MATTGLRITVKLPKGATFAEKEDGLHATTTR